MNADLQDITLTVKDRQLLQIDDVIPFLGFALGQNGHAARHNAPRGLHQPFDGQQGLAVEITSSTIRMRLPFILAASSPSR